MVLFMMSFLMLFMVSIYGVYLWCQAPFVDAFVSFVRVGWTFKVDFWILSYLAAIEGWLFLSNFGLVHFLMCFVRFPDGFVQFLDGFVQFLDGFVHFLDSF